MTKHIDEAYNVSKGDHIEFTTDQGLTVEGTVTQSEKVYPGGPEVTAEVERFKIESEEGETYIYVINRDYNSETGYSPVMDDDSGITKENFDEKSYGYIEELKYL
jgi:hypothetical protein